MKSARGSSASALLILTVALTLTIHPVAASQTFTVIHTFEGGNDGSSPLADLTLVGGRLYGTTPSSNNRSDDGVLFEIARDGKYDAFYHFRGAPTDGAAPCSPLTADGKGSAYGTTSRGGSGDFGTVFKVDALGKETVLYSFAGTPDGISPLGGVTVDQQGNLYGTTAAGGTYSYGTVFEVTPEGAETVLYSFAGYPDGANPNGGLVADAQGNFYGTTEEGGSSNQGTVFKIDPSGVETILHSFDLSVDGGYPSAGLTMDHKGNLYGTTAGVSYYVGTVFRLAPSGVLTVLVTFDGSDGEYPLSGVTLDGKGNLYGTTQMGGAGTGAYGTIYMINPSDQESVLYSFQGGSDGANPVGGLTIDRGGNLYGTTTKRGSTQCGNNPPDYGCGTVFKFTPGN